jgi:hypothetical protein
LNREEATTILRERIERLRDLSYRELLFYRDNPTAEEVIAPSGQAYQIEVEALWDDRPDSDLRVIAAIDDGRLRSTIMPLVQDFIIRPDGSFVGE